MTWWHWGTSVDAGGWWALKFYGIGSVSGLKFFGYVRTVSLKLTGEDLKFTVRS